MGQFKPMVKMQTTEPSVELKLKSGGSVTKEKKMQMGGALAPSATPAPASMPASGGDMAGAAPMRPSLAARRRMMRRMPAGAAPAAPVGQAAQMMKKGGETKKEHEAEKKEMKGLEKELKSHEGKPASKAHKGLKTGGVVKGQGGFKKGGAAKKPVEGGAENDSGKAEKMPQGNKRPSQPVQVTQLSGTFKKGGSIKRSCGG